mmetsp:Transcript_1549/g.2611  ORF Transcript_1549/g.2611 Transcript_1549/m.2611 type:complete len:235 (-) Transcript_1549:168-872(-)
MDRLGNLGSGNLSCSNSPDWLVCNGNLIQIFLCNSLEPLFQLYRADTSGKILFEFRKRFTDAKHNRHVLFDKFETLSVDVIVGFAVDYTTFRVSGKSPLNANGFEHRCGNGTSVGSSHLWAYTLKYSRNFINIGLVLHNSARCCCLLLCRYTSNTQSYKKKRSLKLTSAPILIQSPTFSITDSIKTYGTKRATSASGLSSFTAPAIAPASAIASSLVCGFNFQLPEMNGLRADN